MRQLEIWGGGKCYITAGYGSESFAQSAGPCEEVYHRVRRYFHYEEHIDTGMSSAGKVTEFGQTGATRCARPACCRGRHSVGPMSMWGA